MSMRLDRRQFLMTGVAAAALATSARSAWAASTELRMAWWGGKARADLTQQVLDLYVSENPDVSVAAEYLGWGDYWPRLATVTAGGNSPDVIQMDIEYLAEYASRGVLLDLEAVIPSPLDVTDFQQDLLNNGRVGGKLYAVPCGVNAGALIFNTVAFEEAGVPLPDASTTWEQFGKLMADFTKATPRKQMYGTPDASGSQPVLETWLRQRGKELYNPDGTLAYDETDITDWFEMWAEMRASGAAAPADVQALDHGDVDTSLMAQQRAAVNFENSNQYVAAQALTTEALSIAPYPKLGPDGKGGLYVKPTMFYSISARSANPEAAATLLNFILSDPQATSILGGERGVPASDRVREALKPNMDAAGQLMLDYISSLGELAGPLPPPSPPGQGEVTEALAKASEEVAFGAKSPTEGAADFVANARDILARAAS